MIRNLALWGAGFVAGVALAAMVHQANGLAPSERLQGPAGGIPDIAGPAYLGAQPELPLPLPFIPALYPVRPRPLWADMLPASAAGNPYPWAVDRECMARWDRFDWREYAGRYPWPLDDVGYVVYVETGGTMDLCSVNRSSGATCWAQLLSGSDPVVQRAYLDPAACMVGAYRKWVDGGGSFQRHWFRFWTGVSAAEMEGR